MGKLTYENFKNLSRTEISPSLIAIYEALFCNEFHQRNTQKATQKKRRQLTNVQALHARLHSSSSVFCDVPFYPNSFLRSPRFFSQFSSICISATLLCLQFNLFQFSEIYKKCLKQFKCTYICLYSSPPTLSTSPKAKEKKKNEKYETRN